MDDLFKVVCGACQCDPGLTTDVDGEVAICPGCGQRDRVDEAFRIAGEHHALRTARPKHMTQTFRWHAKSD